MTQEEKELLFKDLSARLSYGVVVQEPDYYEAPLTIATMSEVFYNGLEVKPYLRPMSSMTEEEYQYYSKLQKDLKLGGNIDLMLDFYLSHYLDFRGLIPMGLALEAHEDMYE